MSDPNLVLYVASYGDATSAEQDFAALKSAQDSTELVVVGAVVMKRSADGKVDVKEHGPTAVGGLATIGGIGGLVVGLFAPPLLLATAVGAGIGAGIGALVKRHQEKQMGVDMEEYLPPGSSAIVVVLDDQYLDRVEKTLAKATKNVNKAIDSGDYDQLQAAIAKGGADVEASLKS